MTAKKKRTKPKTSRTCGCRQAGILLNCETLEIERCDECGLFKDDDEAAEVVESLLKILGHVFDEHPAAFTVRDALDLIGEFTIGDEGPA